MYAIAFDLDTQLLQQSYPNPSYQNAYTDIRNKLIQYGFNWQQGSVYFGDQGVVNAVVCAVAVMDLTRSFAWFSVSVRDIRMLRIEEDSDLRPVIDTAIPANP